MQYAHLSRNSDSNFRILIKACLANRPSIGYFARTVFLKVALTNRIWWRSAIRLLKVIYHRRFQRNSATMMLSWQQNMKGQIQFWYVIITIHAMHQRIAPTLKSNTWINNCDLKKKTFQIITRISWIMEHHNGLLLIWNFQNLKDLAINMHVLISMHNKLLIIIDVMCGVCCIPKFFRSRLFYLLYGHFKFKSSQYFGFVCFLNWKTILLRKLSTKKTAQIFLRVSVRHRWHRCLLIFN